MIICREEYPRVAFMPDTFHEVNGVAHTSRNLEAFVRRRVIPFLSIHPGPKTEVTTAGGVTTVELERGAARFALDADVDYDPFLVRHVGLVEAEFRRFKPDLIHLTGPGDMATIGTFLAVKMGIPLVISWHTSLHEYAGKRLERLAGFMGPQASQALASVAESAALQILRAFYSQAAMVMAPNQELIEFTRRLTGRPVYLMERGVDTGLFNPAKRTRLGGVGGTFRIGYVGRLTTEKNVRMLARVGADLLARGVREFEIVVVGQGIESEWLKNHVPHVKMTGVLRGEELATAYADMDLFAFPSTTDTYGNVILEALASGVPCVVTSGGGPKYLVTDGVSGYVAGSEGEFLECVARVVDGGPERHAGMRAAAREYAMRQSWDAVFEAVFAAYGSCVGVALAA